MSTRRSLAVALTMSIDFGQRGYLTGSMLEGS